ncbi:hypothetical protein D3C72_1302250 [compost metagenome]
MPVALMTAMPMARAPRLRARSGVVQKTDMAVYAPVDAMHTPSSCTMGLAEYAVKSQPAADSSMGQTMCQRRSCKRSERRPQAIMPMTVHTCGMAASRPICVLLALLLKLFTISGVHTATIARVLTRQK